MTKQLRVSGRHVPWSLALSVFCWLVPGVWSGFGTLVPSLLVSSQVRDSGWFGSGTLAVLAGYTVVVIGVPILMLFRSRVARALLSLVAGSFAIIVIAVPPMEPMLAFIPVALGAVLMWVPPSNYFFRKRIIAGNGAVL